MHKADGTPLRAQADYGKDTGSLRFMFYLLSGEVRHVDESVVERGKDVCHAKQQLALANLEAEKNEESCVSMRQMRPTLFLLFLSLKFP